MASKRRIVAPSKDGKLFYSPTIDEATAVIRKALAMAPPPRVDFDAIDPAQQTVQIYAVINLIQAMQQLGYRIAPPLRRVS